MLHQMILSILLSGSIAATLADSRHKAEPSLRGDALEEMPGARELATGLCKMKITELCLNGGQDAGKNSEVNLRIFQGGSTWINCMDDFADGFRLVYNWGGCIPINREVSSTGPNKFSDAPTSLRVKITEKDTHEGKGTNDVFKHTFHNICDELDSGVEELSFDSKTGGTFTFKFGSPDTDNSFRSSLVVERLNREWPEQNIEYKFLADRAYMGLPSADAKKIYKRTGLSDFTWTSEVFDCDDFSFVYKGTASKYGYEKDIEFAYALGTIFGCSSGGCHAVNVFIDEDWFVKIIEPQNGRIIHGKNWNYSPYFVLM